MSTSTSTLRRTFAAGAIAAALATPIATAGEPSFQGLGDFPGGGFFSEARGISADGTTVVGRSMAGAQYPRYEAFRWTRTGGMVGIGYLPGGALESIAQDVSCDGSVIVGYSEVEIGRHAFLWTAADGMVDLNNLTGRGFHETQPIVISADGSTVASNVGDAFRWTQAGGVQELGSLPGYPRSTVYDISDDGSVIVGSAQPALGPPSGHAFRWIEAGGMVEILANQARAVSADGSVVVGTVGNDLFHWTDATGLVEHDRPEQFTFIYPNDVSGDGSVVVGSVYIVTVGARAFMWDLDDELTLVSDLLTQLDLDLTGWTLTEATGISADGRTIVGNGTNPSGQTEAWIAHIPEPATFLLLALAAPAVFRRARFRSSTCRFRRQSTCRSTRGSERTHPAGVCLLAAMTAALLAPSAFAGQLSFQGLGGLTPGTSAESAAMGISADGTVVVGRSIRPTRPTFWAYGAFRWTQPGGMVNLGGLAGETYSSVAHSVSNDGAVIVGYSTFSSIDDAFLWTADAGLVSLDTFTGRNFFSSEPIAVSADGAVVAGAADGQAVRWTQASGIQDLGFLPETNRSKAYDVSADGSVVVGSSEYVTVFGLSSRAFRWTAASGMVQIGSPVTNSIHRAYAVSADGAVVVGRADGHAFRWTEADGMVALNEPFGFSHSSASAVSDDGLIIVGRLHDGTSNHASIWQSVDAASPLEEFLENLNLDLTGWTLTEATGISADGRTIVGNGTNPSGQTEAWIAHIPEPATFLLLALTAPAILRRPAAKRRR